MDKLKSLMFFSLVFCASYTWAQSPIVGKVLKLKGTVLQDEIPLREGSELREGDTLLTKKSSFVRIGFKDNTFVNIGSDSEFHIKSYRQENMKRKNNLKILKGKVRVWVNKIAEPGEQIVVNSKQITLGIRGTEFLVNSYAFGGAPSTDVLLVKGSLKASGAGFTSFTMEPGQFFNSQDLLRNGMKALKSLSAEALSKLKASSENFIPDLQSSKGLLNLGASLVGSAAAVTGLASALIPSKKEDTKKEAIVPPKEEEEKIKKKVVKKKKRTVKTTVGGVLNFKYDLKKEKWDIRDAVMNRKKNLKDNKCFYFFYKKLPGAGEPERFRRERDCDEFENDL